MTKTVAAALAAALLIVPGMARAADRAEPISGILHDPSVVILSCSGYEDETLTVDGRPATITTHRPFRRFYAFGGKADSVFVASGPAWSTPMPYLTGAITPQRIAVTFRDIDSDTLLGRQRMLVEEISIDIDPVGGTLRYHYDARAVRDDMPKSDVQANPVGGANLAADHLRLARERSGRCLPARDPFLATPGLIQANTVSLLAHERSLNNTTFIAADEDPATVATAVGTKPADSDYMLLTPLDGTCPDQPSTCRTLVRLRRVYALAPAGGRGGITDRELADWDRRHAGYTASYSEKLHGFVLGTDVEFTEVGLTGHEEYAALMRFGEAYRMLGDDRDSFAPFLQARADGRRLSDTRSSLVVATFASLKRVVDTLGYRISSANAEEGWLLLNGSTEATPEAIRDLDGALEVLTCGGCANQVAFTQDVDGEAITSVDAVGAWLKAHPQARLEGGVDRSKPGRPKLRGELRWVVDLGSGMSIDAFIAQIRDWIDARRSFTSL